MITKNELLKLKKQIDKILQRLEDTALEKGINITSSEFQQLLLAAKKKLLNERGIMLEEYSQMMQKINTDRKINKETTQQRGIKIEGVEMIKGEPGDTPVKGVNYFTKEEIQSIKNEILSQIKIPAPQITNEIVKEIIKEKPITQVIQTKEIVKEIDSTQLNGIKLDITNLQLSLQDYLKGLDGVTTDLKALKDIPGQLHVLSEDVGWAQRKLKKHSWQEPSISGLTRTLADALYVPYTGATGDVNLGIHTLLDHTGVLSFSPDARAFYGETGLIVAGWGRVSGTQRGFLDGVGGNLSLDIIGRILYDSTVTASLNYNARYLLNSNGALALDWSTPGSIDFQACNLITIGGIGLTGNRVPTGFFTDLEITNLPTSGGIIIPTISSANVITNKRNTKRVDSQDSTNTITPEISNYDIFTRTAQAHALAINNHSTSTPSDGDMMLFVILSDATPRAITYGNLYVAKSGYPLPTTTATSKCTKMLFYWRESLTQWDLLYSSQE